MDLKLKIVSLEMIWLLLPDRAVYAKIPYGFGGKMHFWQYRQKYSKYRLEIKNMLSRDHNVLAYQISFQSEFSSGRSSGPKFVAQKRLFGNIGKNIASRYLKIYMNMHTTTMYLYTKIHINW